MVQQPLWIRGLQTWLWLTYVADVLFALLLLFLACATLAARGEVILGRLPLVTCAGCLLVVSWGFREKQWWMLRAELMLLASLIVLGPICLSNVIRSL